jgi:hypothetical protein
MRSPDDEIDVHLDLTEADVGDESGSPGDVELAREHGPGTGSEADELWRPTHTRVETIHRDDTGKGRRSP